MTHPTSVIHKYGLTHDLAITHKYTTSVFKNFEISLFFASPSDFPYKSLFLFQTIISNSFILSHIISPALATLSLFCSLGNQFNSTLFFSCVPSPDGPWIIPSSLAAECGLGKSGNCFDWVYYKCVTQCQLNPPCCWVIL